jgi:hypothetical protein
MTLKEMLYMALLSYETGEYRNEENLSKEINQQISNQIESDR